MALNHQTGTAKRTTRFSTTTLQSSMSQNAFVP